MKQTALLAALGLLILGLVLPVSAAQDIVGDWKLKSTNADGPPMDAIMMVAKDKDGKLAAKWLSFFGPTDLKEFKFEGDKLTFVQTVRFGDQEYTSNFSGTLKDGKITGTFSSDRGDMEMEGALMKPRPAIAGVWEVTVKRSDRETTATLTIKSDKDGKLSGMWKSQRGEGEISDVNYKDDKLTFKRQMQTQDGQQAESTYELTVKGSTMTGKSSSPRGEAELTGKRTDSPAVGTWELTITSDRGERKQLLMVYPDMTALYGPSELDKFAVEENKMSFKMKRTFGDRSFELEFKGTVEGDKLTGEMSSTGGPNGPSTQKVTGSKLGAAAKAESKPAAAPEAKKETPAAK
jgi:hypothetical protein